MQIAFHSLLVGYSDRVSGHQQWSPTFQQIGLWKRGLEVRWQRNFPPIAILMRARSGSGGWEKGNGDPKKIQIAVLDGVMVG